MTTFTKETIRIRACLCLKYVNTNIYYLHFLLILRRYPSPELLPAPKKCDKVHTFKFGLIMYKYLFCLNARFSYNSFDKKEKWPQC